MRKQDIYHIFEGDRPDYQASIGRDPCPQESLHVVNCYRNDEPSGHAVIAGILFTFQKFESPDMRWLSNRVAKTDKTTGN